MTIYYDDYEELEEAREEDDDYDWDEDEDGDEPAVIAVTFENSFKKYHYFTDNLNFEKGDRLLVKQYQNRETAVTIIGYCEDDDQANRKLNVIKKLDRKIKPQKRTNRFKKEEDTMKKSSKVVSSTKVALTEAKDVAVKFQKGSAVIIAIKTAIFESDMVPDKVKALVEAGNGVSDLIIGLVLQVVAETFTESEVIQEAAKAANFSGAVSASSEFTMIQDAIENIVGSAVGKVNFKTFKDEEEKETAGKRNNQ